MRFGFPYRIVLSIVQYRTFLCLSDYYIYDKDCDIFDSEKTIPAQYKVKEPISDSSETGNWISGDVTITADESNTAIEKLENAVVIHGYAGSTAQAYAEKYNRKYQQYYYL